MTFINECVNKFFDSRLTLVNTDNRTDVNTMEIIKIFYENQMNEQYKKDDKIIKDIINKNITVNNSYKIVTHIYYHNQKVNNLIMKNNLT